MSASISNIVRLPSGVEYDIDRYGDYPLYSTFHGIVNGVQVKLQCFNYIKGDTIPGTVGAIATELDTNLDKISKGVGYTEEMLIYGIAIQLPHRVAKAGENPDIGLLSDLVEIIDKTYFHFDIQNKIYAEGTLDCFPFFGGLWGFTTLNQQEYMNNGMPQSASAKPLALPIHITGKSTFQALLEFPNGALALTNVGTVADNQDYKIRVWLLGIRSRYEGATKGVGGK